MDQVKQMVASGVSVATAIKELLARKDLSVSAFCEKYDRQRQRFGEVINLQRYPEDEDLAALQAELGGPAHEWRWFLYEQARPRAPLAIPA